MDVGTFIVEQIIKTKSWLDQALRKGGLIVAFILGWEDMRDSMK